MPPIDAPSVPGVYQLLKSVGHSSMVLPVLVGPYIGKTGGQPWRTGLQTFRVRLQAALDSLDQTDMPPDWRAEVRAILQENIAFADACLTGGINYATIKQFGERQGPRLKKIVAWAAETQVAHWMGVIADWKRQLGADWEKTYAASNTIYVARQNNVLFSVLAQFFGPEAINQRLILIETISFTTSPEEMLELADADRFRPHRRSVVLRQLLHDGLRVDGLQRPRRHRQGVRQGWHDSVPAAAGAVRLQAMADAHYARARARDPFAIAVMLARCGRGPRGVARGR